MFLESEFNGDISHWDVSHVTDMSWMFWKSKFDGDISQWNISDKANLNRMFYCTALYEKDRLLREGLKFNQELKTE